MLRAVMVFVSGVFGLLAFYHTVQVVEVMASFGATQSTTGSINPFVLEMMGPHLGLLITDGSLCAAFAAAFGVLDALCQIRDRLPRKAPIITERTYAEPTFTRESGV